MTSIHKGEASGIAKGIPGLRVQAARRRAIK
jgi:hypothetical protein